MYIYKIVLDIEQERESHYDGDGLKYGEKYTHRETTERYLAAYSDEHAIGYVTSSLKKNGWKVTKIRVREIFLNDIRDSCDHTTDFDKGGHNNEKLKSCSIRSNSKSSKVF